ncbi:anti-sigma factor RsbA family regulatory protein [Nonomuraea insulae]|uniref:Anti-sigma factor RsbA family regulatory protein n=1 Tax=Nonomuraea insulae TaxID=1616787 RepID=A0ABW1CR15_9ACTN
MNTGLAGKPLATGPELSHHALIYRSTEEFLAGAVPFCRDGLAADEKVLVVTTPENIESLSAAVAGVEFADSRRWYDAPGRALAAYNRYVDTHGTAHRRVRILGEPVWQDRGPAETAEWTRYESVLNAAFADRPVWIVCPYAARALPRGVVADAHRTHPHLLSGAGAYRSIAYTEPDAFTCADDHLPLPPPPADTLNIAFDDDLRLMRNQLTVYAKLLALPVEQVERLLLAVSELAANALEHGGGHGRVQLWADGEHLVCDVTDPGRMEVPYPGYLPPSPAAPRGQGLWVVRQLCELVEIRTNVAGDHGTQIRLRMSPA